MSDETNQDYLINEELSNDDDFQAIRNSESPQIIHRNSNKTDDYAEVISAVLISIVNKKKYDFLNSRIIQGSVKATMIL